MTQDNQSRFRILMADDVEINRYLVKVQLRKFDFDIEFASNGEEVIEKLKNAHYDIILMDLQMPVMDGYETAKKIRAEFENENFNIPILAVTGYSDKTVIEKCFHAGINDHITKPYSSDDLYNKIINLLSDNKYFEKRFCVLPELHKTTKEYELQYINLGFIEEVSEGNVDFVREMIEYFLSNTPAFLLDFKKSIEKEDWDSIRQQSHKFSTQLSYMGINMLVKDVELIEKYASEKKHINIIKSLIVKIEIITYEAIKELQSTLKIMNKKSTSL
jgi:CheY-like chemotaxis protein